MLGGRVTSLTHTFSPRGLSKWPLKREEHSQREQHSALKGSAKDTGVGVEYKKQGVRWGHNPDCRGRVWESSIPGVKLQTHSAKQPLVPKLRVYSATYQCIVFITARRVESRGSTRCFTSPLVNEQAQGSHPTQILIKPHTPWRGCAASPIGARRHVEHVQRRIDDAFNFHPNKRWLLYCHAFAPQPASFYCPSPSCPSVSCPSPSSPSPSEP